ncbi:SseB family protein [Saccharopolyspora gloriosae]|uniref:SseB family protein n=1 Tax=Saccharopolyspora gloriosae TaxID=455344 RepID=UPI001FB6A279|nr:SseB family protein [Saccharopolyspora gloriosae]
MRDVGMDLDEPSIVRIAGAVRSLRSKAAEFDAAFAQATVYAQRSRSQRPGVIVSMLPDNSQWVLAFSTMERLAAFHKDVPWMCTTGEDLLEQLPPAIGVLFDVGEEHGLPLIPQPNGAARFASAPAHVGE